MPTIREVKTELRHREWAEQIQAESAFAQKVIVRKDGIEVEMPADISPIVSVTMCRSSEKKSVKSQQTVIK